MLEAQKHFAQIHVNIFHFNGKDIKNNRHKSHVYAEKQAFVIQSDAVKSRRGLCVSELKRGRSSVSAFVYTERRDG